MYIVRWLMSHPIMSFYALLLVALVLHFSNGDKEEIIQTTDNAGVEQVIVDDSKIDEKIEEAIVTTSNKNENKENSNQEKPAEDVPVVEKTANQIPNTTEEQKTTSVLDSASVVTKNSVSKVEDVISSSKDKIKDTVSALGSASSDVVTKVEKVAEESIDKVQSVASGTTIKLKDATNAVLASASNVVTETKEIVDTKVEKVKTTVTSEVEKVANSSKTPIDGLKSESVAVVAANDTDLKKENHQEIEDLDQSTPEEMLLMAREAYWNNGLDEAAQIYKQLIKLEPNTIEHKGELGNVYWRQGYPKKAAELYSEIALPMVKSGSVERVSNMIGFIGLFYPDRAAEIHKQIQLKK